MPNVEVRIYRDARGNAPLSAWRKKLLKKNKRAYAKCLERIARLEREGQDLRRPLADILRDGIHELRARSGKEQHRLLYFFVGKRVAVLSQGFQKEGKVDGKLIDAAVQHKANVDKDAGKYSMTMEEWVESFS